MAHFVLRLAVRVRAYVEYPVYWKEEPKARKWKPIEDTPEARQTAINKKAMFFTWMKFSKPYNESEPEPIRTGDLPLDFDDQAHPENALKDLRALCLVHLPEYGIDPYEIDYFLSGGKGFHAIIPDKCLGSTDGHTHLPLIYKKMVSEWAVTFTLKTIDMSLYDMKRGKMFRIENVKRNNGKHKVPLTLEEVRDLPYSELLALGDAPRSIDPVVDADDLVEVEDLADALTSAREYVETEQKQQTTAEPYTENEISNLSAKIPPCVKYLIAKMPGGSGFPKINFNKLVLNLTKYCHIAGLDYQNALGLTEPFLRNYPHSGTYTTFDQRLNHFKGMFLYLQGRGDAPFQCSYMKAWVYRAAPSNVELVWQKSHRKI